MRYLYKITNLINGKIYIGQTKITNYENRMICHCLGRSKSSLIGKAILKYGKENFEFKIITIRHKDFIDVAEILAIKYYKSKTPNGYNIDGGGYTNKEVSEQTRRKIAEANRRRVVTDETKQKIGEFHKGKTLSEEHKNKLHEGRKRALITDEYRLKMSALKMGKKLKPLSEERKLQISRQQKGRKHSKEHIENTKKTFRLKYLVKLVLNSMRHKSCA